MKILSRHEEEAIGVHAKQNAETGVVNKSE
jgi:hypothetical protein